MPGTDRNVCPTQMNQRKRIAIYGGTFDPVHNGHIEVAQTIVALFDIDEFLFMPARIAPHKTQRRISAGFHRYTMLALVTNNEDKMRVSTFELERPERQFTVDTLRHFRLQYGPNLDLFFVMGADSWSEITTWREWQELPQLANLVVITRPTYEVGLDHVGQEVAEHIVDLHGLDRCVDDSSGAGKIYFTDAVLRDVSATQVRVAAASGDDNLENLVPPAVAQYIRKYGLYRNTNEARFNC